MLERAATSLVSILLVLGGCWSDEDPGAREDGGRGIEGLACELLQREACRGRADCVEDTCFFCDCRPVFQGCRAIGEMPAVCPDLDCAQPECCQHNRECEVQGHLCHPPEEPSACNLCVEGPGDCYVDSDCADGDICEPVPCHCGDARACVGGCEETSCQDTFCSSTRACPSGLICNGEVHPRCIGPDCHGDEDCEPDFECNFGDCERRRCVDDSDCLVACVKGRCHAALGICGSL